LKSIGTRFDQGIYFMSLFVSDKIYGWLLSAVRL